MRTTLNIDDELMKEAKIAAIKRGTTLTALVEEGLRKEVQGTTAAGRTVRLPVGARGSRPRVGVDFDRLSELIKEIDELEDLERLEQLGLAGRPRADP